MANSARSREPSLKPAKVTKALGDGSDMDVAGFRMGKQRIVGKKKKKSALKKLIVAEREVRSGDKVLQPATPGAVDGNAEVSSINDTVDAPAYIPAWTFADDDAELKQDDGAEGADTVEKAGAAEATAGTAQSVNGRNGDAPRNGGRRRPGSGLTGAAPEYLPSWIVQGDVAHEEAGALGQQESDHELLVSAAIEHLRVVDAGDKQKKKEKPKQPAKTTSNIEVRHYVHQVLSDELDEKVKAVLGELARFQERARENPMKYAKQKRFCVGLREATRSVTRGKARCLIMAPNLEASAAEGGLDDTVEDLMDVCREHEVPVVYALSRNRIGKALGKNIRLSIVCILSAEGVHQEFRQIIKMAEELRRQWVMRKMSQPVEEVAQAVARSAAASAAPSGAPSGAVSGVASDNEDEGVAAANDSLAESISERVRRHLEAKQAEAERKREAEREEKAAERAANKERKAKERAAKQAAKRAEQKAAKEAERREQEEQEERERQTEEERRRIVAERDAARQAEIARRDKERAEAEEKRRAEAAAKAAAAAAQKQAAAPEEEEEEEEDDSDDEDLPIGFCADLL